MKQSIKEHRQILAGLHHCLKSDRLWVRRVIDKLARSEIDYVEYEKQVIAAEKTGKLEFERK